MVPPSIRTAGFPQYGWKVGRSDGALPVICEEFASCGWHPSFVHRAACNVVSPFRVGGRGALMHHRSSGINRFTPGALSGRTMARIGLRMMPPFPSSPLSFRTADFLQSGWKAGNFRRGLPVDCEFRSRRTVCLRPSCTSLPSSMPRSESRDAVRWCTTVHTVSRITPGVLATVQVVLSWSINAY